MSQQQTRGLSQSKEALLKSYTIRLKDDIKAMLDNFTEVIKLARVSRESYIPHHISRIALWVKFQ